jgi:hypothetical protein
MGLDAVNVHDEVLPIYNWISHLRKDIMEVDSYIIVELVARV